MSSIAERSEWERLLLESLLPTDDQHARRVLRQAALFLKAGDAQLVRDLVILGEAEDPAAALLLLVALLLAGHEGSLCLRLDETHLAGIFAHAGTEAEDAREAAGRIEDWLSWGPVRNELVSFTDSLTDLPCTPVVVLKEKEGPFRIWWQRLFLAGGRLEAAFAKRRQLRIKKISAKRKKAALARGTDFRDFSLNQRQVEAVSLALDVLTLVLSGGPGTGKTTTVAGVLRALYAAGLCQAERVALAAPTGRAAQRMKDSLIIQTGQMNDLSPAEETFFSTLDGMTIHRLLEYHAGTRSFRRCPAYPLEADVVVIDEVSMVDIELMVSLIEAVRVETRLILIGDRDQLPSVNAGAILADILPALQEGEKRSVGMAAVILEENRRSRVEITQAAAACNAGNVEAFLNSLPLYTPAELDKALASPLARINPAEGRSGPVWKDFVKNWLELTLEDGDLPGYTALAAAAASTQDPGADHAGLAAAMLKRLDSARMLALVRHGRLGVEGLNSLASDWLRERLKAHGLPSRVLQLRGEGGSFHGLPIILSANDHGRRLYNGDVGIVLGKRAWFRESETGGMRSYPVLDLGPWEAAFAITVHRSQGSEYERVMLVFPGESGLRLLARQIVYTGITRAREGVILLGTEAELQDAVRNVIVRESGLRLYD